MIARPPKGDGNACPLCGDPAYEKVLTGKDLLHGIPGQFDLVRCKSCSLHRVYPFLNPDELARYYPPDYRPFHQNRQIGKVTAEKRSHLLRRTYVTWLQNGRPSIFKEPVNNFWKIAGARLLGLTGHYRFNPFSFFGEGKSVFDVGCADGHFLAETAALGWVPHGSEQNSEAAKRAKERGFDVVEGDFIATPIREDLLGAMDLVIMREVLEHFTDPFAALGKARELLKPGGMLCLWTPVINGVIPRIFKEHWYNLDLPRHQVLFLKKNVTALVKQAGFSVLDTQYYSSAKSITKSLENRRIGQRGVEQNTRDTSGSVREAVAEIVVKILDLAGLGDNLLLLAQRPKKISE